MKITHTVLKNSDIENACTPHQFATLQSLGNLIYRYRLKTSRDPEPKYIVINMDEPYINEIIEVLKHNGHWD